MRIKWDDEYKVHITELCVAKIWTLPEERKVSSLSLAPVEVNSNFLSDHLLY